MYIMYGLLDSRAGTLTTWGVRNVLLSADICDKRFLLWRICTTAYRKYSEEAGKATWFFRQGYEL